MNPLDVITRPQRVWSAEDVTSKPCPVPSEPGVYGWFFKNLSIEADTSKCVTYNGLTLLYAGISPKAPTAAGRLSTQNLRKRIRYHYRGNAEGSTLRKTLGCLLSEELDIQLRRVGSGKRLTFSAGEQRLTEWMAENAFVAWLIHPTPWVVEHELISTLDLPLNLDQNRHNAFHGLLSRRRAEAVRKAKDLAVLPR